jgi:hypothetical protein
MNKLPEELKLIFRKKNSGIFMNDVIKLLYTKSKEIECLIYHISLDVDSMQDSNDKTQVDDKIDVLESKLQETNMDIYNIERNIYAKTQNKLFTINYAVLFLVTYILIYIYKLYFKGYYK